MTCRKRLPNAFKVLATLRQVETKHTNGIAYFWRMLISFESLFERTIHPFPRSPKQPQKSMLSPLACYFRASAYSAAGGEHVQQQHFKNGHLQIMLLPFFLSSSTYKRAGSNCLFHAGLAHNCDYRDVIASVNEMNHWGSNLAPGRRRRRWTGG